jgi:hypothetical protein
LLVVGICRILHWKILRGSERFVAMLFFRRSYRSQVDQSEKLLSLGVILGLGALLSWIAFRGQKVDGTLFRLENSALRRESTRRTLYQREVLVRASHPAGLDLVGALLGERLPGLAFRRQGPVETYGIDNLYVKIDGRETLYKANGFRKLWWASYKEGPESLDVEIFQHENALAAFGIFSAERAGMEGAILEPTRTVIPNGLYFVVGAFYVRTLGSSESAAVKKAAERIFELLQNGLKTKSVALSGPASTASSVPGSVSRCPPGYDEPCALPEVVPPHLGASPSEDVPSTGSLPGGSSLSSAPEETLERLLASPESWTPLANPLVELGADPASLEFHLEYGLGLRDFSHMYLASLPVGERAVRVFLLSADHEAGAQIAFSAYRNMLGKVGKSVELDWLEGGPEEKISVKVDLLDTYEAGFQVGPWVAGVTEAEDREVAEDGLAIMLGALMAHQDREP